MKRVKGAQLVHRRPEILCNAPQSKSYYFWIRELRVMRIKREPWHFFKACKMIWNIISTEITCANTFRSGLSERGLSLSVTPGRLIVNWLNSPAYQTENAHPNSMFSPTSVCLQRGAKPVRRDREWAFKYAGPADAPKAGQRVFYYYDNTLT